jgi:hypothetical protein
MRHPLFTVTWVLVLALSIGLFIGWYAAATVWGCDTDDECRYVPKCLLTPGCDGGPDPAHQPWPWLP